MQQVMKCALFLCATICTTLLEGRTNYCPLQSHKQRMKTPSAITIILPKLLFCHGDLINKSNYLILRIVTGPDHQWAFSSAFLPVWVVGRAGFYNYAIEYNKKKCNKDTYYTRTSYLLHESLYQKQHFSY